MRALISTLGLPLWWVNLNNQVVALLMRQSDRLLLYMHACIYTGICVCMLILLTDNTSCSYIR